ncbi:peptidoglycan recognition protein family protein [Streptomyces sp. H27-D2]|uniref:peptidoglycan recognition protein family protein n=1 Tax=Streptomyces sp. H27-D2 TaxID=3046304 RepID=UPI002DB9A2E5|nr:peptidoglycan recognition protein [Streptomyces sp. H27-D2]MEC4018749.1 peptidoglycan recognition protein [Streptomyces sp. H27-D2]
MRIFLATSIGAACTTALMLPFVLPLGATASAPHAAGSAPRPGSTQSLPLAPSERTATGRPDSAGRNLPARDVKPYSLVGVVWKDAAADLHARVQVRNRPTGGAAWSRWQDVQAHNDDAADPGSAERRSGRVRGSTAPLWVGDSDGVELRVSPEASDRGAHRPLPAGLRLELVNPGGAGGTTPAAPAEHAGRAVPAPPPPPLDEWGDQPAADHATTGATGEGREGEAMEGEARTDETAADGAPLRPGQNPYIGERPEIVSRAGWGADETLREQTLGYTRTVKAAFVHHSATGNNYTCAEAPSVIRAIYRYHVKSSGWRDMGYNFLIDKCGTIYEGRAGGVTKAVMGAHTLGFNTDSTGIAALGTYTDDEPPAAVLTAIAKLTAWKLGLYGANPRGVVTLVSAGSNKFAKGAKVQLNVISGHRDGVATACPGDRLYDRMGAARTASARLQGR